jgi:hypothetical protein
MKRFALAALFVLVAFPAMAQGEPDEPGPPPEESSHWATGRWFFGGGFGASFGTVESVLVAPMVGLRVAPRVSVGVQLYYSWVNDGRYSPHITTNDYGSTLFVRTRVWKTFFVEGDYQYSSYEFPTGPGTTDRTSYDALLAGGGYGIPMGKNASFYVSALYDFMYNGHNAYLPYDSPWRIQVGAMIGF